MIRIQTIWLALGASDLRGGVDKLLALVVHGFALGDNHIENLMRPWPRGARRGFSLAVSWGAATSS